jgi:hypothetical protein
MAEARKLAGILVADTVDHSRHAGADEERRDFLSTVLLA